ncbi:SAV_915 family protein [Streptomyces lasiicapitis]|uniref:SAV_915 family protein n=1 Tax=Streptomyces lasiicapitis TaxID=1923961 RepID=UPI0036625440
MSPVEHCEDPEPSEPVPAGSLRVLHVPVRSGTAGCAARFFRTPLGGRTAVGFTSLEQLVATLGADQPWITLAEPALRALAAPLGITTVTVDPQLTAPWVTERRTRTGNWHAQPQPSEPSAALDPLIG